MTLSKTGPPKAIAEGFPGQRMLVLSPQAVRNARVQFGTRHLHVTDFGYFPDAHRHGRRRAHGIDQAIILLVAKGSGWCETPHGRYEVRAGNVVVVPPGEPHAYGASDDDPWTLWWLHLGGTDLAKIMKSAGMTAAAPVRRVASPYVTMGLIEEVLIRMEQDVTDAGRLAASGAAWHLIALLASERTTVAENSAVLDQAAHHIRTHLAQRLEISALASAANLSRPYFCSLFKKQFGMTILQYQTQLRMSRSRELLDTTDRPIVEVASAVGYDDAFYFARVFRADSGASPRSYRQRGLR